MSGPFPLGNSVRLMVHLLQHKVRRGCLPLDGQKDVRERGLEVTHGTAHVLLARELVTGLRLTTMKAGKCSWLCA